MRERERVRERKGTRERCGKARSWEQAENAFAFIFVVHYCSHQHISVYFNFYVLNVARRSYYLLLDKYPNPHSHYHQPDHNYQQNRFGVQPSTFICLIPSAIRFTVSVESDNECFFLLFIIYCLILRLHVCTFFFKIFDMCALSFVSNCFQ